MAKPEKPTRALAMQAICHECLGYYADGKVDCENPRCALYTWMPYRKMEPNMEWFKFNPKSKGRVTWEDSERKISDEAKQAAADRLRKMHESNA